jgi:hypothetical protein
VTDRDRRVVEGLNRIAERLLHADQRLKPARGPAGRDERPPRPQGRGPRPARSPARGVARRDPRRGPHEPPRPRPTGPSRGTTTGATLDAVPGQTRSESHYRFAPEAVASSRCAAAPPPRPKEAWSSVRPGGPLVVQSAHAPVAEGARIHARKRKSARASFPAPRRLVKTPPPFEARALCQVAEQKECDVAQILRGANAGSLGASASARAVRPEIKRCADATCRAQRLKNRSTSSPFDELCSGAAGQGRPRPRTVADRRRHCRPRYQFARHSSVRTTTSRRRDVARTAQRGCGRRRRATATYTPTAGGGGGRADPHRSVSGRRRRFSSRYARRGAAPRPPTPQPRADLVRIPRQAGDTTTAPTLPSASAAGASGAREGIV